MVQPTQTLVQYTNHPCSRWHERCIGEVADYGVHRMERNEKPIQLNTSPPKKDPKSRFTEMKTCNNLFCEPMNLFLNRILLLSFARRTRSKIIGAAKRKTSQVLCIVIVFTLKSENGQPVSKFRHLWVQLNMND